MRVRDIEFYFHTHLGINKKLLREMYSSYSVIPPTSVIFFNNTI